MSQAIISLGSNMGNRVLNLNLAIQKIQLVIGNLISLSAIYESASWGFTAEKSFLNQVIEIKTELTSKELLMALLEIEDDLGRRRNSVTYESRNIDLDILFYEQEIVGLEDLKIPHPKIQDRNFVLIPLTEILPNFQHPQFQKTIEQMLNECSDKLWVKKFIR